MQISRMTIPVNDSKNMMRFEVPEASLWVTQLRIIKTIVDHTVFFFDDF